MNSPFLALQNITFTRLLKNLPLPSSYFQQLTAPYDGMWESFVHHSPQWEIRMEEAVIGRYAILNENTLIHFSLVEAFLPIASGILGELMPKHELTRAIVSTNDPLMLTACMDHSHYHSVHTLLFHELAPTTVKRPEMLQHVKLTQAQQADKHPIVDFCAVNVGGNKGWLDTYLQRLIDRSELFFLQNETEILGTCEVRKSDTQQPFADVGMIVGEQFRRQGLGAYLLGEAARICAERQLTPICSCEASNHGSRKAIERAGFRSRHRLLEVVLEGV